MSRDTMNPEWVIKRRVPTPAEFDGWCDAIGGEESIPARWAESKQYARAFKAGQEWLANMTMEELETER
jgi:hypothetical protein